MGQLMHLQFRCILLLPLVLETLWAEMWSADLSLLGLDIQAQEKEEEATLISRLSCAYPIPGFPPFSFSDSMKHSMKAEGWKGFLSISERSWSLR